MKHCTLCEFSTIAHFGMCAIVEGMKRFLIALVIIIILIGGYFVFTNYSALGGAAPENTANNVTEDVQIQDTVVGEGAEATPGTTVSVLYVGRLEDGTVFDSSEAHGNEPLTFVLGEPGLIPGFQIGVNGMKEGGERVMAIPPSLGYGAQAVQDAEGNVIVPANAVLIFNVRLVAVGATSATDAVTEEE